MKKSIYKSYDDLPLFLNAELVAKTLGISISSAYELMRERGFPSLRIGKRIVIPKEELRKWISTHTKGCSDAKLSVRTEHEAKEFLPAPQRDL